MVEMDLSYYIALILVVRITPSRQTVIKQHEIGDDLPGVNKIKRSTLGRLVLDAGLEHLIQSAKLVYSNGLDQYLMKQGSSFKAAEDFYSVKPANIKESKIGGEIVIGQEDTTRPIKVIVVTSIRCSGVFQTQVTGDVGTRRVILQTDKTLGNVFIKITKHPLYSSTYRLRTTYDQVGDRIIIYTD